MTPTLPSETKAEHEGDPGGGWKGIQAGALQPGVEYLAHAEFRPATTAPVGSGPEVRSVLHLSSVGIFGLVLPANCTSEPLSMNSEASLGAGGERLAVSGTLTVPVFHCDGEWLPEPFGSVLTNLAGGSGNSYELALER